MDTYRVDNGMLSSTIEPKQSQKWDRIRPKVNGTNALKIHVIRNLHQQKKFHKQSKESLQDSIRFIHRSNQRKTLETNPKNHKNQQKTKRNLLQRAHNVEHHIVW